MTVQLVIGILVAYFLTLIAISFFTSKQESSENFFTGNRQSPWYVVAFGMIGASLSGVTFISIPGWVQKSHFSYLPMCVGYVLGYFIIAFVLMPVYYRLKLVSIYAYLKERFGMASYKSGATLFLISRLIGASFRLYLVASVLQLMIFNELEIPFEVSVFVTILLIWVYTFKGGIKTIVWTDTLQTLFMLLSAGFTVYWLGQELLPQVNETSLTQVVLTSPLSKISDVGNPTLGFLNGVLIALVMTGLDQDMMQKNLSIKTLKDAQTNMVSFSLVLVLVNVLFLSLGVLLYSYIDVMQIDFAGKPDQLFPLLATKYFPVGLGALFLLGITSAAYSSADSALTSLTTSFCYDILGENNPSPKKRYLVHFGFSIALFVVIVIFNIINDDSVVSELFTMAGYSYGPLLGLYALGLFSNTKPVDKHVPWVCIISPALSYLLASNSEAWFSYKIGFELLLINAIITVIGILLSSQSNRK